MPTTRENQKKIDKHIKAFKRAGGKIKYIERGVTGITGPKTMRRAIATQADKKKAQKNV